MTIKKILLLTGCPPGIEPLFLHAIADGFPSGTFIYLTGQSPITSKLPDFASWFYSPRNDRSEYYRLITAAIERLGVTDVIPLIDSEVIFFARHKVELASRNFVKCWVADIGVVERVIDKSICYQTGPSAFVPKFKTGATPWDISDCLKQLVNIGVSDFVTRPSTGVNGSGKGVRLITDSSSYVADFFCKSIPSTNLSADEYLALCRRAAELNCLPTQLVTEYLPGREYSCYIAANRGICLDVAVQLKLENESGTTNSGEAVLIDAPMVSAACAEITRHYELDFLNNIQLKEDGNRRLKLIEINPRIAGSIHLAESAGKGLISQCYNAIYSPHRQNRAGLSALTTRDSRFIRLIRSRDVSIETSDSLKRPTWVRSRGVQGQGKDSEQYSKFEFLIRGINTVIFDLDNTLYSEWTYIHQCITDFLVKDCGIRQQELSDVMAGLKTHYMNFGNHNLLDFLESHISTDGDRGIFRENFFARLRGATKPELSLPDIAVQMLSIARASVDHVFCVTDGNIMQQKNKVECLALSRYITEKKIIYSEHGGGKGSEQFRSKFSRIASYGCYAGGRTLVVGDSEVDQAFAEQLGAWFTRINVGIRV